MKRITFRQFISTYNFRDINESITKSNGDYEEDAISIRIHLPFEKLSFQKDWIDLGVYDFSSDEYKMELCETFLSKEILDSYVETICLKKCGAYRDMTEIYLTLDKEEK